MNQCVGNELKTSDAQLNAMYGQIRQRLKNDLETAKLLTGAQRAWVAYRDAECAFSSSSVMGGSMHPMVEALCADRMTQNRIGEFKAYVNCKEGDTACPVPAK